MRGYKYIQNLANDLKEYGKGYSIQNLKFMSQPVTQIPWYTLVYLNIN